MVVIPTLNCVLHLQQTPPLLKKLDVSGGAFNRFNLHSCVSSMNNNDHFFAGLELAEPAS